MTRRQRGAGGAVAPHSRDLVAASFEGPLPPPSMLEHYNEIVPGAAERILAMADARHMFHVLSGRMTAVRYGNFGGYAPIGQ